MKNANRIQLKKASKIFTENQLFSYKVCNVVVLNESSTPHEPGGLVGHVKHHAEAHNLSLAA